jgi:hypothetical protein
LREIPSKIFGKKPWLDFNMLQSARETTIDAVTLVETALTEGLPVVDGESLYENFGEVKKGGEKDRRTPYQVRDDAYSQLFAGAFGNTYGHGSIFRFWEETVPAICEGWGCTPNMTWKEALAAEGAKQMQYVTELMQSRPIVGRVADQSLIAGTPKPTAVSGIVATKGEGYAMIYTPHGADIPVELGKITGSKVKAWWYNPKTGDATEIGVYPNSGTKVFKTDGVDDMVLILDDISKSYSTPGQ